MENLISVLLKKIHFYYPIGMPHIHTAYPGYDKLREIIGIKIDEIVEEVRTPWTDLIGVMQEEFKNHIIHDYSYYQFPNYYAFIELVKSKENYISFTRSIVINISLLTNHYTVFFEDNYQYCHFNTELVRPQPITRITYNKSCTNDSYLKMVEVIKTLVERVFKDYSFVHHYYLLKHKIEGGIKYGEIINEYGIKPYSIYEYLFFCYIDPDEITVLE